MEYDLTGLKWLLLWALLLGICLQFPKAPPEGEKQALTLIILSIEYSRAKMCSDIQTRLTKKSINTTMQVAQSADIRAYVRFISHAITGLSGHVTDECDVIGGEHRKQQQQNGQPL